MLQTRTHKQDSFSLIGTYCSRTVTCAGVNTCPSLPYLQDSLATLLANLSSLGTLHGGALLSPVFLSVFSHSHRSLADVKSDLLKTHGLQRQVQSILPTSGSFRSFRSTSSLNCMARIDQIIVSSIHMATCYVEREHLGLLKFSMQYRGSLQGCCCGL